MGDLIKRLQARAAYEKKMADDDWMCPPDRIFGESTIEITRLRRERDEWREDRDRVLTEQTPWMKMIEAVYPDNEYDFGEALAMIIKERDEARRDLAAANGILDEIANARGKYVSSQIDIYDLIGEMQYILSQRKGGG